MVRLGRHLGDTDAALRELQRSLDTAGGTPEPADIGAIALYLGIAGRVEVRVRRHIVRGR
jgi:hypothetical protein